MPPFSKSSLQISIIFSLVAFCMSHNVRQIKGQKQQITGYIHQVKSISIPFDKCFLVEPQIDANQQYMEFKPSTVSLNRLKHSSLKQSQMTMSTFQDIRSPIIFQHKNIIIFKSYILVFSAPNRILIVKETSDGFNIQHSYLINNLDKFDQFKIYKLNQKAFLTIFNKDVVYLLNQKDYQDFQLPYNSVITHFEQISGQNQEFFAAEQSRGLTHYKLKKGTKKFEVVTTYAGKELFGNKDKFVSIVDINLKYYQDKNVVYVLDAKEGLVELDFSQEKPQGKLIVNQSFCESFDSEEQEHFVLICQNQGYSTIVEAYQYYDKKTKSNKYKKVQPIFHSNYLNDLYVDDKFYMVYSPKNIHVFWNIRKNKIPQATNTKSQIYLPAIQTFILHKQNQQSYFYSIQSGEIIKYRIQQQKAVLTIKSNEVIERSIKIYIYGSCLQLTNQQQTNTDNEIMTCRVSKDISFKFIQEDYPRREDFSISASIIIILIIVFLLVIWICLKKYKGLEREARKVLHNYQHKRNAQRQVI